MPGITHHFSSTFDRGFAMAYMRSVIAAALTVGCATTPAIHRDARLYSVSAETTRSETDVISCARSRVPDPAQPSGRISSGTATTAYGSGPISDFVSFTTARVGNRTVLTVSARSYVRPDSGRGEANSNAVAIPVSDAAKSWAGELINACAEASS